MTPDLHEIRQAFAAEGGEMLSEIERALLSLEERPDDTDEFNRLFRAIHTLKGSAGIVGFQFLERFCHDVECLLEFTRSGELQFTAQIVTLLLECHDQIRNIINSSLDSDANRYEPLPADLRILDAIGKLCESCRRAEPGEACYMQQGSSSGDGINIVIVPASAGEYAGALNQCDVLADKPDEAAGHTVEAAREIFSSSPPRAEQRFARVDTVKLDQLIDLIAELVTATSVMEADAAGAGSAALLESSSLVSSLAKIVQEKSMSLRMVPVNILFRRFRRIVQDAARESGKAVRLEISGGDTEIDRSISEKLGEPLLHIVRNALDHGIETPEERREAGKDAQALLMLNAFQYGGEVVIEISDDGRGVDRDRIIKKAKSLGISASSAEFSSGEILDIICTPGFSTLDKATLLSGRGVGMDAVKATVDSMRGGMEMESRWGSGTVFRIRIPLSLSVVDGFMVEADALYYIIPMEKVLETVALSAEDKSSFKKRGYINLRETPVPCFSLRNLLGGRADEPHEGDFAVVVKKRSGRAGFVVDRFIGETKAVVKPLGRIYRNVSCISGASIMPDGSIALLLETENLAANI